MAEDRNGNEFVDIAKTTIKAVALIISVIVFVFGYVVVEILDQNCAPCCEKQVEQIEE